MKTNPIEERLIRFAISIVQFHETLSCKKSNHHLINQLLRSGTSPALNYGEARGAESKKDFIHKMKICLKELRESYNCLRIIIGADLTRHHNDSNNLLSECNELISIFVKSIITAKKNEKK